MLVRLILMVLLVAPVLAQESVPGKVILDTPTSPAAMPDSLPATAVTDAERSSVHVDAVSLDLHLTPADALEEGRASLTLRNVGREPLARIPLQISSTLRWQSIAAAGGPVTFTQSPVATDTDHTGYAQEAVLVPAAALAPGATLMVTAFYSGKVEASAARLTALGATPEQAAATDWDAIQPTSDAGSTALRGFGDVLWYPVAGPVALLGETNKLFATVAAQRVANETTRMQLRLTVLYVGDPPDGVIFDGVLAPLNRQSDDEDALVGEARGIATAEFPLQAIGFRVPNLFLTAQEAQTGSRFLAVVTPKAGSADPYSSAVDLVSPLEIETLGPAPLGPLLLLDHRGQPFEDHALLVAQLSPQSDPKAIAPALVRPLTHAWFRLAAPAGNWLDQGVPELMSLLYLERTDGREAVLAELRQASNLIALAEPDLEKTPDAAGQPLTSAATEVYLHRKAAAVLWQLRDLVGEAVFRDGLVSFRHALVAEPELAEDAQAFERALERVSGKDLKWFFADWVYRDRGLPDLTIVAVNPRPLATEAVGAQPGGPPGHPGRSAGYLVAVEVRNDGDAAAEVPVSVRAAGAGEALTTTVRLRIAAHATASTRVVFETVPEVVQVNDGTVPELRSTSHTFRIQQAPGTS